MEKKKDIFTKSVFKDIILVQKIASFQSQSRVIDNKTLTSFVYTLLFRLILERIMYSIKAWAVYYYLIGGCLAIPLADKKLKQFPRPSFFTKIRLGNCGQF